MKKVYIILVLISIFGCASQKSTNLNSTKGDTRTKEIEFLDDNTYFLTETSTDKTYGFDKSNPIQVGGSRESLGPKNERRFLNALLGPNGEKITYFRTGSCCSFKTPNGTIDNLGLLDRYKITWNGSSDTIDIYINMYDKGDLFIPVGLTAKKKN